MKNLFLSFCTLVYSIISTGCAFFLAIHDKPETLIIAFLALSVAILLLKKIAGNISELQFGEFSLRAEKIMDNLDHKYNEVMEKTQTNCDHMMYEMETKCAEVINKVDATCNKLITKIDKSE